MNDREQFEACIVSAIGLDMYSIITKEMLNLLFIGWEACAESKQDEIDALRNICAEAYQLAGHCNAPIKTLDNLSAAANGESIPHESFLPIESQSELDKENEDMEAILKDTQTLANDLHRTETALDKANARIAQLEEALVPFMKIISTSSGRIQTEKLSFADWHGMIKAAFTTSDTWLSEHDKAVEVKVLEEIVLSSKLWTDYSDVVLKMIESRK